ncbi:MAG TPA: hypothetical protein P5105_02575 [Victivallales bacterium]|nr:hypothetical protein [Candidatus Methanofastidiosa archaeon]HRR06145.1 hypothetical protein [Victivallales bacterium]
MKTGNTKAICKKGKHGMTKHGVYSYKNGTVVSIRCLECAREQKNLRRQDKEKYEHDKAYSKQWYRDNKERHRQRSQILRSKEQEQRKRRVENYFNKMKPEITRLLKIFESPLTLKDIKNHCYRLNTTSIYKIKAFIINNKRSKLLNREAYMQSYVVKYAWGIAGDGFNNYSSLPERTKEKIRKEYKDKAKDIVNKKIAELCANI